jgi:hypothetical protein
VFSGGTVGQPSGANTACDRSAAIGRGGAGAGGEVDGGGPGAVLDGDGGGCVPGEVIVGPGWAAAAGATATAPKAATSAATATRAECVLLASGLALRPTVPSRRNRRTRARTVGRLLRRHDVNRIGVTVGVLEPLPQPVID